MEVRRAAGLRHCALADRAFGRQSAGLGSVGLCSGVFFEDLRVVFFGYEQESSATLVRHDSLREPGEGATVLCAEEKRRALTTEGAGEYRVTRHTVTNASHARFIVTHRHSSSLLVIHLCSFRISGTNKNPHSNRGEPRLEWATLCYLLFSSRRFLPLSYFLWPSRGVGSLGRQTARAGMTFRRRTPGRAGREWSPCRGRRRNPRGEALVSCLTLRLAGARSSLPV